MSCTKEPLVIASKVRAYLKEKDCMVSGELIGALSCVVAETLDKAAARTKANKRQTVKACDL
jgi:histone H3/H4